MSMHTWTVSGIGFELFTGNNYTKVIEFLQEHREAVKDFFKDTCRVDVDAFFEEADEKWFEMTDEEREEFIRDRLESIPAQVVAHIIDIETGYTGFVGEPRDEDQTDMVLWEPYYPWQMNERDKEITEEKLESILKEYAEKLGANPESVGNQTLSYCG